MKSQNRMSWISSMNLHQRKTRKDLFLICHFWKSSVERNKSISQKNSHKIFLLLLKIFQSTTYPTAHNLCNIKTKEGTCKKKFRPTRKYLNIKQLEVPKHKKKEEWMKKKKINISRTLMSKEILQKRHNYSASNIFFHFFRTKHKCSQNQPKHNQSSNICKND